MVAYDYDGDDVVISCRRTAAKFANVERDPRVVVAVPDERRYLAVAGTADVITAGRSLLELTLRLQRSLEPADASMLQGDIDMGLERAGRVVLRLVPERVVGRI